MAMIVPDGSTTFTMSPSSKSPSMDVTPTSNSDVALSLSSGTCFLVDVHNTLCKALAVCNPLLDLCRRVRIGTELRVHSLLRSLGKLLEDVVSLTVGDDNLYAFVGNLPGYVGLGHHSAAAEVTLAGLDIFAEVAVVVDHRDDTRVLVGRIAVEDTVYIGENDQRVGVHHRCHESCKLIVIGEHQLQTLVVSFSLTIGTTPFSSITFMQALWLRYSPRVEKLSFIVSTCPMWMPYSRKRS